MIAIQSMETHIGKREVIAYLKTEQEVLREKLKGVEQAIATLERLFENKTTEDTDYEETSTQPHSAEIVPFQKSRSKIPTTYEKDSTYSNKILYILNKEDEMSTVELRDYILKMEPELAADKKSAKLVGLNVSKAATRLADEGKTVLEKIGNQNYYRLK